MLTNASVNYCLNLFGKRRGSSIWFWDYQYVVWQRHTLGDVINKTKNIKKPSLLPKLWPSDNLITELPSNRSYIEFTFVIFKNNRKIIDLNQLIIELKIIIR